MRGGSLAAPGSIAAKEGRGESLYKESLDAERQNVFVREREEEAWLHPVRSLRRRGGESRFTKSHFKERVRERVRESVCERGGESVCEMERECVQERGGVGSREEERGGSSAAPAVIAAKEGERVALKRVASERVA